MLSIYSFLYRQRTLLESNLEFLPLHCGRGYSDWPISKPAKLGYFFAGTNSLGQVMVLQGWLSIL